MTYEWVFDVLVKSDTDHEGLIAYALYKHDKSQRARQLHADGYTKEEIDEKIKEFHDIVLENLQFQRQYKARALAFLVDILQQARDDVIKSKDHELAIMRRKHISELEALKSEHKKERVNYEKNWVKQVKQQVIIKPSILRRVINEMKSGAMTALFTVIFSAITVAVVLMLKVPHDQKRTYLQQTANEIIDTVAPPSAEGTVNK